MKVRIFQVIAKEIEIADEFITITDSQLEPWQSEYCISENELTRLEKEIPNLIAIEEIDSPKTIAEF